MDNNIEITSLGVKRSLSKFTEIESILEYIWNGFDAKASHIDINLSFNLMGAVSELIIRDNGVGIDRNKLQEKFKPFFQSEKIEQQIQEKKKKNSTYHGKNGVGRLTFFKFSRTATWETIFNDIDGKNKKYSIDINEADLTKYTPSQNEETTQSCGTVVRFNSIFVPFSLGELTEEIKKEFCWYLLLNQDNDYSISINGQKLDISNLISEIEEGILLIGNYTFNWKFVNWTSSLNKEYSRYYFIKSSGYEAFKQFTTFNNKGDKFYHSLYVKSEFFDAYIYSKSELENEQLSIFQAQNNIYKILIQKLDSIISNKRTPYIRKYSRKIIDDLEEIKAFDNYKENDLVDNFKKSNLQDFIQELYVVEPKIFAQLNKEQKLTMVRLLDASMNAPDKDNLFKILDSVLDLSVEEKQTLSKVLEVTPLNNITKTINFLLDRLRALEYFEQAVYDKNLGANEVNDLQYMLEQNYWLFGEQYSAVAQAEDNFVVLVKNHLAELRKDDGEENIEALKEISSHPDKLKQVDLCCVRQMPTSKTIENIIVEIKHPLKVLTQTHYQQVRKYMDIITSVKEFIADNYKWTFYLIGSDISKSLQDDINNLKGKGVEGLVFEKDNFKIEIIVRTWKSIFNDYKIKYNNIYNKLKIEEQLIVKQSNIQSLKLNQSKLEII